MRSCGHFSTALWCRVIGYHLLCELITDVVVVLLDFLLLQVVHSRGDGLRHASIDWCTLLRRDLKLKVVCIEALYELALLILLLHFGAVHIQVPC